jgi:hypothetical protein
MTERLDAFLEALSRRNLDDLGVVALSEPDPTARGALLRRATAAAAAAGADRLAEVRAVPDRVQAIAFRSFAFRGYEPTWFGLNWGRSIGRADDRARLVAAVEDAAVADVGPTSCRPTILRPFENRSSSRRRWPVPRRASTLGSTVDARRASSAASGS